MRARTARSRTWPGLAAVVAAVLLAGGCDVDETVEDAAVPEGEEDPVAPEADGQLPAEPADPELAAFCQQQVDMDRRAGPDWLGSDEHVEALDELIDLAPDEIREEIRRIRDHIDAEVSPDDPASRDISTYPARVREAIEEADEFAVEACGFTPPEG